MKQPQPRTITAADCKLLAQFLAVQGVRNNTALEQLHSGTSPSSKAGDFSDVFVVSPYGKIPWNEVSRFGDAEMRSLMLSVERALLASLEAYLAFSTEQLNMLPAVIINGRSYDDPNVSAHSKANSTD